MADNNDFFEEIDLRKIYPNRKPVKTAKSVFDIQYETARKEAEGKRGVSFYCRKLDKYIFIENSV
jgi:hypothetical protein